MISKRTSFADKNVVLADRIAFRKAATMEKNLMHWAFDFSAYPERSMPWREVAETFSLAATTGYKPQEENLMTFVRACQTGHRMESSLRVEQYGLNTILPGIIVEKDNCLVLRIKFYYKNDRREFLEWQMSFVDMGRIHQAAFTGRGEIGQRVMK
jgi:hypothetical protein